MSTPYSGGDYHPENFGSGSYGTPDPDSSMNYGYNGYDYSSFDVNSAAAGQGAARVHGSQLVDGTYGDGSEPHFVNDPAVNGWYHVKGTGKMKPMQAWGYGFKQTFANWKVWIGLTVLAVVLLILIGVLTFWMPLFLVLLPIIVLVVSPFVCSFALIQTLMRDWKLRKVEAPTYGKTLGMIIFSSIIMSAVSLVIAFIARAIFGSEATTALQNIDPATIEDNPEVLNDLIWPYLKVTGFNALLSFLVQPLFTFLVWFAADNAGSFGNALKEGFKAAARNYGQLLLFNIIFTALTIASAFILFAPMIIFFPAGILATAYAYRQVSGGPVPTEPTAAGAY